MKVKDLDIKVTYEVGLLDVDIPENVYKQLIEAYESGHTIEWSDIMYPEASEWIDDNIKEKDASDLEIEVNYISQ